MTREEAIEYLKRADITVGQTIKTRTAEALEMAIEALQTEPYFWEKCPYYEPDIMFDGKEEYDWGKCTYKTKHSDDRKNCPHRHENGNCLSVGGFCLAVDDKHCQLKNEPCGKDINIPATDAISRQAAIDCVSYDVEYSIECLEALPSVMPQKVVRCKDCKYVWKEDGWDNLYCNRVKVSGSFAVERDGFCAWGEMEEGE